MLRLPLTLWQASFSGPLNQSGTWSLNATVLCRPCKVIPARKWTRVTSIVCRTCIRGVTPSMWEMGPCVFIFVCSSVGEEGEFGVFVVVILSFLKFWQICALLLQHSYKLFMFWNYLPLIRREPVTDVLFFLCFSESATASALVA